jgi:hypothetical protein
MPYDKSDARSQLATADKAPTPTEFGDTSYVDFHRTEPADRTEHGTLYWGRAQNFVVGWLELTGGEYRFDRAGQPDEYIVMITDDGVSAHFEADGATMDVSGQTLNVVPPGDSTVTLSGRGGAALILSDAATDLMAVAANAADYAQPKPNVAPITPWPEPVGGFKLRSYDLTKLGEVNPKMPIYRTTNMMINFSRANPARDLSMLSPHSHDDFEQCSLVIKGEYVHHIRWPWTPDGRIWRDDTHVRIGAPSITVIQPPTVHTSQAMLPDEGANHLIDIFAPPRADFSAMPGWVLNADDYPVPADVRS